MGQGVEFVLSAIAVYITFRLTAKSVKAKTRVYYPFVAMVIALAVDIFLYCVFKTLTSVAFTVLMSEIVASGVYKKSKHT